MNIEQDPRMVMMQQLQQLQNAQPDPLDRLGKLMSIQGHRDQEARAAQMQDHQLNTVYPNALAEQNAQTEHRNKQAALAQLAYELQVKDQAQRTTHAQNTLKAQKAAQVDRKQYYTDATEGRKQASLLAFYNTLVGSQQFNAAQPVMTGLMESFGVDNSAQQANALRIQELQQAAQTRGLSGPERDELETLKASMAPQFPTL